MADDLELSLRLTADNSGLVGSVRVSAAEVDKLGSAVKGAGTTAASASGDFDKTTSSTKDLGSASKKTETSTGGLRGMLDKLKHSLTGTTTESGKAGKGLKDTAQHTDKLGTSSHTTSGLLTTMGGALAALGLAVTIKDLIDANIQYERLNASLTVVTGSADAADAAFDGLSEFASNTPFAIDEVVTAFIKLGTMGLEPSEAALESYGNTAASMGKDLNQMIEAVADASVGEFERLKEFGIKASVEGENVSLTFQGITTEIKNSSEDIQEYLIAIGEVEFAGAMDLQMDTLGGAFSNLEGSVNSLYRAMGETGASDAFADVIRGLSGLIGDLTYLLTDGLDPAFDTLTATMQAWIAFAIGVFDTFALAWYFSLAGMGVSHDEFIGGVEAGWDRLLLLPGQFGDALMDLPTNLAAVFTIMIGMGDQYRLETLKILELLVLQAEELWLALSAAGEAAWLGIQLIGAGVVDWFMQAIGEIIGALATIVGSLPDFVVPDGWAKGLDEAALSMKGYSSATDAAKEAIKESQRAFEEEMIVIDESRKAIGEYYDDRIQASKDIVIAATEAAEATKAERLENVALEREFAEVVAIFEKLDRATLDETIAMYGLAGATKETTEETEKLTGSTEAEEKALGKLLDQLFPCIKATEDFEAELALLDKAFFETEMSTEFYDEAVERLTTAQGDAKKATDEATVAVKANAAEADAFSEAWGQALSRIDEAFADAWRGAFESFDEFADQMVVAMEQLLAEMAHAAITQPIIMSLGMTGTVGSNYSGGAASGATGSYTDPITGITSFFGGNSIGQGFASSGNYLASTTGIGAAPPGFVGPPGGGIFEGAAGIPNWQYGAYGLGGYFLGDTLFEGEYAGMGGSLGALGGAALGASYGAWGGPVGAGIGAIGGAAVGSLFGGDVPDPAIVMRGGVAGTLPTGQRTSVATGAFGDVSVGFHDTGGMDEQTAQDAAQAIADMVADVDNIIASTLDEAEFAAAEEAAQDFYRKVDDSAENLAETLIWRYTDMLNAIDENLGTIFSEGTDGLDAEEVAVYAASLALVQQGIESLTGAHDAYEIMIGGETQTLYDATKAQGDALAELILNYDGSYESTLILSGALQDRYGLEIMLIGEIEGVIQNVQTALGDTAEMIRIDQLSQTQRYTELSEEADALALSIEDMLDPTEINDAIIRIDEIINEMYSSLDPEGQAGIADSLILFLDETMATATQQLEIAKTELSKSSGAMAEGLATAIDDAGGNLSADIGDVAGMQAQAASDMQSAASGMDTAANTMLRAAQTPQTIVVQVEQQQAVGF